MTVDQGRIEAAVAELLAAIGEDATRPGLQRTPKRVAEAYAEYFAGMGVDPVQVLRDGVDAAGDGERGDLVLLRGLEFRSMCEHHLLPFRGVAHVGYLPADRMVGLSTLARVVEYFARDLQMQERMTTDIAAWIERELQPRGTGVMIEAEHLCMSMRGVGTPDVRATTSIFRGTFTAADLEGARR